MKMRVPVQARREGQDRPERYMRRAFGKPDDERVRRVDVDVIVSTSMGAFPAWLRGMQIARFLLATVGALAVIALLVF
jgi:hypothetical protein